MQSCLVGSHFNGLHPRCSASVQAPPFVGRPLIDGAPGLSDVSTSHDRLRTSIPAGARDLWSKCLIHALASVVAHRDERSWVDLLTMACPDSWRTIQRWSSPRPPASHHCLSPMSGLVGRPARRALGAVWPTRLSSPTGSGVRLPSAQSRLQPCSYPHPRRCPPTGMHSPNPGTARPAHSLCHR